MELDILLAAALDLLVHFLHHGLHVHDGLLGDVTGKLDHLLADLFTDEDKALDCDLLLPDHHEALLPCTDSQSVRMMGEREREILTLGSTGVKSPADGDGLLIEADSKVLYVSDHDVRLVPGLVHLLHSVPKQSNEIQLSRKLL